MAALGWDNSAVGPAGIAEPGAVLAADDAADSSDSSANVAV